MKKKNNKDKHVLMFNYKISVISQYFEVEKSGSSVVDNMLDYQSRDRKTDSPFLRFFG